MDHGGSLHSKQKLSGAQPSVWGLSFPISPNLWGRCIVVLPIAAAMHRLSLHSSVSPPEEPKTGTSRRSMFSTTYCTWWIRFVCGISSDLNGDVETNACDYNRMLCLVLKYMAIYHVYYWPIECQKHTKVSQCDLDVIRYTLSPIVWCKWCLVFDTRLPIIMTCSDDMQR